MGRRHGIRKSNVFAQRKRDRKNKGDVWDPAKAKQNYADTVRESEAFYKYYKMQNICAESDWDHMIKTLQEDLPTAFRITGSKSEAYALLAVVEGQFFKDLLIAGAEPGEEVKPPQCLPWYPDRLAWQLQITRKDIRRSEAYYRLHNFLIAETNTGNISRQEAVSMIPPLLLDVKPHHKVLDMCAAPGSKTAQLIEMLHAEDKLDSPPPKGFVLANDMDNARCYMLVHQAKRLNSSCIVITNHDASQLPNMQVTDNDGNLSPLKFDRILCDVPCTGDGTLRKNPDIWPKWNAANGNNLHGIQFRVARRGLELLEIEGRMVYSTCSLNPIENEAVIHRLLKECDGAVELVDVSKDLPGLKYVPGMESWLPCSKDLVAYKRYEDVPEQWSTQVRPTMFPPSKEDAPKYNLSRCLRILPHLQNTGGFFVAVLRKTRPLPWQASSPAPKIVEQKVGIQIKTEDSPEVSTADQVTSNDNGTGEAAGTLENAKENGKEVAKQENEDTETAEIEKEKRPQSPPRKKRRIQGYKEDPFVFFTEKEELWPVLCDFYDLQAELSCTTFLTRCKEGKKKNIYFTNSSVRDLVINNEDRIKLINTGVKTFARCDNKAMQCPFRLAQEGLKSIVSFIGPKRRVHISKPDLILLLSCEDPRFPPELESLTPSTRAAVEKLGHIGSLVVEFEGETSTGKPLSYTLVGWKGSCSLRAYVTVSECVHILRLLGEDVSKFEVNKFKDKSTSAKKESPCVNESINADNEDVTSSEAVVTNSNSTSETDGNEAADCENEINPSAD